MRVWSRLLIKKCADGKKVEKTRIDFSPPLADVSEKASYIQHVSNYSAMKIPAKDVPSTGLLKIGEVKLSRLVVLLRMWGSTKIDGLFLFLILIFSAAAQFIN